MTNSWSHLLAATTNLYLTASMHASFMTLGKSQKKPSILLGPQKGKFITKLNWSIEWTTPVSYPATDYKWNTYFRIHDLQIVKMFADCHTPGKHHGNH